MSVSRLWMGVCTQGSGVGRRGRSDFKGNDAPGRMHGEHGGRRTVYLRSTVRVPGYAWEGSHNKRPRGLQRTSRDRAGNGRWGQNRSPGSRRGQVLLLSVARRARMKGRPRVGAGVRNPALDRGRIPTALGRPSALREARIVLMRANHGPPERGRQSGGRTARESTSGAGSGICTRKVGRQGRRTRPGPTARPKTVAGLTSSTERRSREYGVRRAQERGDRARERERTEAGSPRARHVEANANPSRTATVVRKVGHLAVGQHRPVRRTWASKRQYTHTDKLLGIL